VKCSPLPANVSEGKAATYAGLTPLSRQSAQGREGVEARPRGEQARHQTNYLSAIAAISCSAIDAAYHRKQKELHQGHPKPHVKATLALARQRFKVKYKLMTSDAEYDKRGLDLEPPRAPSSGEDAPALPCGDGPGTRRTASRQSGGGSGIEPPPPDPLLPGLMRPTDRRQRACRGCRGYGRPMENASRLPQSPTASWKTPGVFLSPLENPAQGSGFSTVPLPRRRRPLNTKRAASQA